MESRLQRHVIIKTLGGFALLGLLALVLLNHQQTTPANSQSLKTGSAAPVEVIDSAEQSHDALSKNAQALPSSPRMAAQNLACEASATQLPEAALLAKSVRLEYRREPADANGRVRDVSLYRTNFKYPLVRIEEWFKPSASRPALTPGSVISLNPAPPGMVRERRDVSVADHLMVRFPEQISQEVIESWASKNGFTVRHKLRTTPVYLISTSQVSVDASDAIAKALAASFKDLQTVNKGVKPTEVLIAERDYLVFPSLVPNDTSFTQLWGMRNTGQTGGVADADIDADEAWDLTTGSRSVVVGIIDTGLNRTHSDLFANVWRNPNEVAGNGIDDDHNGFIDDVNGWDFYSGDNDPSDVEGHGTHVAGTIGATGNNSSGVVGVNWQVSMVSMRFLGPGGGSTSDAIDAINYATGLHVAVTSNSWGGGDASSLLKSAIDSAGVAGIPFVVAAGNDSSNNDLTASYPASYNSANIIAVAASTASDTMSSFSNYGVTSVDLAAPGSSIYSTVLGNGYAIYSGTSMATPHVSGAIALVKAIAPDLSVADIKQRLLDSVDHLPAFASKTVSGGRLNVHHFLELSSGPLPSVISSTVAEAAGGNGDGVINPGETFNVALEVANLGTEVATNVVATITAPTGSQFTVIQGTIDLGNIGVGVHALPLTSFALTSPANTATPVMETWSVELTYNTPTKHRSLPLSLALYTTSRVSGVVTASEGGAILSGATVEYSGPSAGSVLTRNDGSYDFQAIDGTYTVKASAAGFLTSLGRSVLTPPSATGIDFALRLPYLEINPLALSVRINSGDTMAQTLSLHNRAALPLSWNVSFQDTTSSATTLYQLTPLPITEGSLEQKPEPKSQGGESKFSPTLALPLGLLTSATIGLVLDSSDSFALTSDVVQRGATVINLSRPLTSATLANVTVMIMDDAVGTLTTSEVAALRARVSNGAGLFLCGDYSESMTIQNTLIADAGILTASVDDYRDLLISDVRIHPITAGITQVHSLSAGATLSLSGRAIPLLVEGSGVTHAAITSMGSGNILVVGNEIMNSGNFGLGQARQFDNQAIDYLARAALRKWVTAVPSSGTLSANGSTDLVLHIDATDKIGGTYEAEGIFTNSDPSAPEVILPIQMHVIGTPAISADKPSIAFGNRVVGNVDSVSLTISNPGSDELIVSSVSLVGTNAAAFSLSSNNNFNLAPGGSRIIQVSFREATIGSYSAELEFATNDPSDTQFTLPITATRSLTPHISVSPTSEVRVNLKQGDQRTIRYTISNSGPGPLDWQAAMNQLPGASTSPAQGFVLSPESGSVAANDKATLTLTIDSNSLSTGSSTEMLHIVSQDPASLDTRCPIKLTISPAALITVNPNPAVFSQTYNHSSSELSLLVSNPGERPLVIKGSFSTDRAFSTISKLPLTIAAHSSTSLDVRFKPSKLGLTSGYLCLLSNTSARRLYLPVSGTAEAGPAMKVTPHSLAFALGPRVKITQLITVANNGPAPLNWKAEAINQEGNWLSLVGASGSIAGNSSSHLLAEIDTGKLKAGNYKGTIIVRGNDPLSPSLSLPISLQVLPLAFIEVTPQPIEIADAWQGRTHALTFNVSNLGNIPLVINKITSSTVELTLPNSAKVPAGSSIDLPLAYLPLTAGNRSETITFVSNAKLSPSLAVPFTAVVVPPPNIAVAPGSIADRLSPTQSSNHTLTVSNSGGVDLQWQAELTDFHALNSSESDLATSLRKLNLTAPKLIAAIPNRYDFSEGSSGDSIADGGNDMFDGGNFLEVVPGFRLSYSDRAIVPITNPGVKGSYFTQKNTGLFTFIGHLVGAKEFSVLGNLGADGGGLVSSNVLTRDVGGTVYKGFIKRVYAAGDPSVNHLIIVADNGQLIHNHSSDTNNEQHTVSGLSADSIVYYLLFAASSGDQVSDDTFGTLMDIVLSEVASNTPKSWVSLGSSAGVTAAGSNSALKVTFSAESLDAGDYAATVRFTSNALFFGTIDVPVSLTIDPKSVLAIEPSALAFGDVFRYGSSTLPMVLHNVGNTPLTVSSASAPSAAYSLSGISFPLILAPRAKRVATVTYAPTEFGRDDSSVAFTSTVTASPTSLALTARSIAGPEASVDPGNLAVTLDPSSSDSRILTLTNTGSANLDWTATLTGLSPIVSLTSDSQAGRAAANASSLLTLRFSFGNIPAGDYTGTVDIVTNDPQHTSLRVPVTLTVTLKPVLKITPSPAIFPSVFAHAISNLPVTLQNVGNAPLIINGVTPSDVSLSATGLTFPFTLSSNDSKDFTASFHPASVGGFTGSFTFATNIPGQASFDFSVSGDATNGPQMTVTPASISETLAPDQSVTNALIIENAGGATLDWSARIDIPDNHSFGSLSAVLQRLDSSASKLTSGIPNRFDFSDGIIGNNIFDGGNDMYDGANYLNTDLGNALPYSDGVVTTHSAVGTHGSYFTRKVTGLFIFVADLDGANRFSITGNLGADGAGSTSSTVLNRSVGGVLYKGFVKRVYNAIDPSVNHLIIVADQPTVGHNASTNTNDDQHEVTGFSGRTRLYYLLFATKSGSMVTDATFGTLMDQILADVALPAFPSWISLSSDSGNVATAAVGKTNVSLFAGSLAAGTYDASIKFTSNDPQHPTLDVPVKLNVSNGSLIFVSPSTLGFADTILNGQNTAKRTLRSDGNGPLTVTGIGVSPASVQARTSPGSSTAQDISLAVTAASSTTTWTANESSDWLSLSKTTGTGSENMSVTLSPQGLTTGEYQSTITFMSEAQTLLVPVSFFVVGDLYITKLQADDILPVIYGLHRDPKPPNYGTLLWIDASTGLVTRALSLGAAGLDFAHHSSDDKLYVLMADGVTVKRIERQGVSSVAATYTIASSDRIITGTQGRILTRSQTTTGATASLRDSADGTRVTSQSLVFCDILSNPAANSFYMLFDPSGNPSKSSLGIGNLSSGSVYSNWRIRSGSFDIPRTLPFVVSQNGQRLFYFGKAISPSDFSILHDFGTPIIASSPEGAIAYSSSQALDANTGDNLFALPIDSTVMAASADGGTLVIYDAPKKNLRAVPVSSLVVSDSFIDFGNVTTGSLGSRVLTITNSSSQDVNVSLSSSNAQFTSSVALVPINRGLSSSVVVRFLPTQVAPANGTLTLRVSGQPLFYRSLALLGHGVTGGITSVQSMSFEAASYPGPFSESGMMFSNSSSWGFQIMQANENLRPNNGTRHLAFGYLQTPFALTRIGGGSFTARNIDIAEYSTVINQAVSVTFVGTKADSTTVSTTFSTDGIIDGTGALADFESFSFPTSFSNLVSLSCSDADAFAIDNFTFETIGPAEAVASSGKFTPTTIPSLDSMSLDIDSDGKLDASSLVPISLPITFSGITSQSFAYTRQSGFPEAAYVIEASQDGQTWIGLTPALDYFISGREPAGEGYETLHLTIESKTDVAWRYRLAVKP